MPIAMGRHCRRTPLLPLCSLHGAKLAWESGPVPSICGLQAGGWMRCNSFTGKCAHALGCSAALIHMRCATPKPAKSKPPELAHCVVRHWLVEQPATMYEPVFTYNGYTKLAGNCSDAAVDRSQPYIRQRNARVYYLQSSIHNIFNFIHHPMLCRILYQCPVCRPSGNDHQSSRAQPDLASIDSRVRQDDACLLPIWATFTALAQLHHLLASNCGHFARASSLRLRYGIFVRFALLSALFVRTADGGRVQAQQTDWLRYGTRKREITHLKIFTELTP